MYLYAVIKALFVSHGPGFKRNYSTPYPIESIELYNVMTGKYDVLECCLFFLDLLNPSY